MAARNISFERRHVTLLVVEPGEVGRHHRRGIAIPGCLSAFPGELAVAGGFIHRDTQADTLFAQKSVGSGNEDRAFLGAAFFDCGFGSSARLGQILANPRGGLRHIDARVVARRRGQAAKGCKGLQSSGRLKADLRGSQEEAIVKTVRK